VAEADLVKLGNRLSRPAFRKAFAQDYKAAMKGAKINSSGIPRGVLNTLASLSEEELEVLATVKSALRRSRLPTRIIAQMV